ncbi:pilin [Pinirhizobacter soli]|uniref:pilin n=1 Tax=Pinirhizobacter soli TaxID=2786953 RepID=UPI00254607C6|nr:pilin [Pinirhizobacter soli]
MNDGVSVWLTRDGEKFGPYEPGLLRQWVAEGKVARATLAWRTGMAEWLPLDQVIDLGPATAPPPPPPFGGDLPPMSAHTGRSGFDDLGQEPATARRRALPSPPSMHWFALVLLCIVTLNIFGLVWRFIQANWVKKIDGSSNGVAYLIVSLVLIVVGYFMSVGGMVAGGATSGMLLLGRLVLFAGGIVYIVGYFAMASSMKRALPGYGASPEIGGITLFFFPMIYMQSQLTWVEAFKRTGSSYPRAAKGLIWCLWLCVPIPAILAAIAIPAYQDYTIRSQVTEGLLLSDGAKAAVAEYYNRNGRMPADNTAAGIAETTDIHGRFVSGIQVVQGRIFIHYDQAAANMHLRGRYLQLAPTTSGGQITWKCNADNTVEVKYLPLSCRS